MVSNLNHPNYFHHRHHQQQYNRQDGVFLGDYRLNPNNYYNHQRQQEGVNYGDYHDYYRRPQQEGVSWGDYYINPKPSDYQIQPKRQRLSGARASAGEINKNYYMSGYNTNPRRNYHYHKQQPQPPFYFSPRNAFSATSQQISDYAASCGVKVTADEIDKYERELADSRPPPVDWIYAYNGILAYERSAEESDGFDVKPVPAGIFLAGNIAPVNLSCESNKNKCEKAAQFAIAAFNAKYGRSKGELKLEKLVRATMRAAPGGFYYITFDATNVAKKITKTYQAKVLDPLGALGGTEVVAFRRQDIKGSKKWYWNDCCCLENKGICRCV